MAGEVRVPVSMRDWRRSLRFALGLLALTACVAPALADAPPPQTNAIYQVFVRSFADSDDPDTIGDLKGLTAKLDYLNHGKPETDGDLEVGILWLMPIFPSTSYHGYDATDYRNVNPEYGSLDDLRMLLKAAHARGVRVILDIPFNHTSKAHPWFREAVDKPDSPRRKYYFIEPANGSAQQGAWHMAAGQAGMVRYFGLFDSSMPDLDFDNAEVRREVGEIAEFWLNLGVDGFRLDAAKHLYGATFDPEEGDILKNNDRWHEFSEHVSRKHPEAILVGEVLGNHEMLRRHAYGLKALLDEPFMNRLRAQVTQPRSGFLAEHRGFLERAREVHRVGQRPGMPQAPFDSFLLAASHDRSPRLASDLELAALRGMPRSADEAYRLAMGILLLTGRYAVLYNGDEVMQRGFKWNGNPKDHSKDPGDGSGVFDETLREPFPWRRSGHGPGQAASKTDFLPKFDRADDGVSVEEQAGTSGMLSLVRGLINLRNKHPALDRGEMTDILNDSEQWMVFERAHADNTCLVLCNLSGTGLDYRFHAGWYPGYRNAQLVFWSDGKVKAWKDTTADNQRIQDSVFVPPSGVVVLRR